MDGTVLENKRICECGCGSLIPAINKKRRPARFVWGHNPKLTEKRACVNCGSNTTYVTKKNHVQWYYTKDRTGFLCSWCHGRLMFNPMTRRAGNSKRLRFKGDRIRLDANPRKGVCQMCGKVGGKTDLHHTVYDPTNPTANTIELCSPCHAKETMKSRGRRDNFSHT